MTGDGPPDLYRPCVGIMLLNRDGDVFAARRIDTDGDAWQMPQGGIDPGETPERAALRELAEETGTANAKILAQHPHWLTYDLPADLAARLWDGRYRGQAQKWFAMRFLGEDSEFDLGAYEREFSDWRWIAIEKLPDLIVPFKRAVYDQVIAAFRHLAIPGSS